MQRKIIYLPLLFIYFLLSSGCATILSSKQAPPVITSNPSGAEVYDERNKLVGTTPFTIQTKAGANDSYQLKKEGFRSKSYTVETTKKKGFIFIDAMLLCLPCIVDVPKHAFDKFEKTSYNVDLLPTYKPREEKFLLKINDPVFTLNVNSELGKQDNHKVFYNRGGKRVIGDGYEYTPTICNSFINTYIEIKDCGSNSGTGFQYIAKEKLIIKPEIQNLSFDLTSGNYKKPEQGKGTALVNWQFFENIDNGKLLGSFPVTAEVEGNYLRLHDLIDSLMSDATMRLLAKDSLYDFLKKTASGSSASTLAENEELKFQQIAAPKFEKTKDLIRQITAGVITIENENGFGSGFLITKDGYILTNYHVVEKKTIANIKFNTGITLSADVVRISPEYDLALLKIAGNNFGALSIGNSDSLELGDDVFAIGTPTKLELGQSVTKGIVSGKREIKDKTYIQTDVSINAGNSGGPLIDEKGQVAGIITMKLVGTGIDGIGFVIPINTAINNLNIKFK